MSVCLLVGRLIGWLVNRSVIISWRAGKIHFHAPIGALILSLHRKVGNKTTPTVTFTEDNGEYTFKTESLVKTSEIKFRCDMYFFTTIIRDTEKYDKSEICKLKIKIFLNIVQDGVTRQNFRDIFFHLIFFLNWKVINRIFWFVWKLNCKKLIRE